MSKEELSSYALIAIIIAGAGIGLGAFCGIILLALHYTSGPILTMSSAMLSGVPILEAVGGITFAGFTIKFVLENVEKAQQDPYKWLIPVLGILAAFIIDIFKELIIKLTKCQLSDFANVCATAGVAGTTTILFVAGGFLWQQKFKSGRLWTIRCIAIVLFLSPLIVSYVWFIINNSIALLFYDIENLNAAVIAPIASFFVLFIITVILSFIYRNK